MPMVEFLLVMAALVVLAFVAVAICLVADAIIQWYKRRQERALIPRHRAEKNHGR